MALTLGYERFVRGSTDSSGNVTGLVGAGAIYGLTVTPSAATGAAIQAAIDGLYALGGGTVYFTEGQGN